MAAFCNNGEQTLASTLGNSLINCENMTCCRQAIVELIILYKNNNNNNIVYN
jgi:hypothetical protein